MPQESIKGDLQAIFLELIVVQVCRATRDFWYGQQKTGRDEQSGRSCCLSGGRLPLMALWRTAQA